MSYPKNTLKLRPTKGLAFDIPAMEVGPDYYTSGENVIFRQGFPQRILGNRDVYTQQTIDAWHIMNVRVDTVNYWVVFSDAGVVALETSNETNIEGSALTTVTQPWEYCSTQLNRVPVFTNGLDAPQYWTGDTGDNFAALPDFPASTTCKGIAASRYHLFAYDIDGPSGHFEEQVLWSDAADPGTVPASWTAGAATEAGDAILADTVGPIMTMIPLAGSMLAYKRSSTYIFDYVGGNEKWANRLLFSSSGSLTRHSVADINGAHFVVADGDIFIHDGASKKQVAQGRMKDYLFENLDPDYYENLFVIYHRGKQEVWVCFPETGSTYCSAALVYDIANDAFGIRDLDNVKCAAIGVVNDTDPDGSWAAATYTWSHASAAVYWNSANFSLATEALVLGYGTTTLNMQDDSTATSVAALVGKYDLIFDDSARIKFVRRVHLRTAPNSGTLYLRTGARMTPNESITWATEVEVDTSDTQVVDTFAQGRYISVEVRGAGTDVWQVTGLDIEAELRGYH